MNKQEMRGVPNSSRDISLLKGRFVNSRVLWLHQNPSTSQPVYDRKYRLHDYFDLVVVQKGADLKVVPDPDIFIHWAPDIDSEGLIEQNDFKAGQTLVCVNYKAAQQMRKRKWKTDAYMLSFKPLYFHPEMTVLTAVGARTNCWCEGSDLMIITDTATDDPEIIRTTLDEFMGQLNKYKTPINLLSKNRPLLMETW